MAPIDVIIRGFQRFLGRSPTGNTDSWSQSLSSYVDAIHDPRSDSAYLRDVGLKPRVLSLLGHLDGAENVLDVGCGDGWLFSEAKPGRGIECDITNQTARSDRDRKRLHWWFSEEDVEQMSFNDATFDRLVASLLLIFVEDLDAACAELHRVAKDGATLVVAIVHPVFYRMGDVDAEGNAIIKHDYMVEREISRLFIANRVGPFRYYHRPLHRYFNALIKAGWSLTEFDEWAIDMDDYRLHCPNAKGAPPRTSRLPLYAFFKCQKGTHDSDRSVRHELDS